MRMEGGGPDAEDSNQSEYFITGQVYDEKNAPMVAVSVRLHSAADSSLINGTGTMTDEMGKFTIKNLIILSMSLSWVTSLYISR